MSSLKIGDRIRIFYFGESEGTECVVHDIVEKDTFIPEIGIKVHKDAYIWKENSGRFSWDGQKDVDNNVDISYVLISSSQQSSLPAQNDMYPHTCPRCGAPAYKGLNDVECSSCGKY